MEGLKSLSPDVENAVLHYMSTAGLKPVTPADWRAGYQLWLEARAEVGLSAVVKAVEPVRDSQGLVLTQSEVKELRHRSYRDR